MYQRKEPNPHPILVPQNLPLPIGPHSADSLLPRLSESLALEDPHVHEDDDMVGVQNTNGCSGCRNNLLGDDGENTLRR